MDLDDEDFICFATPIEREEEISGRKRKAVAEAGQVKSLPPWKQEVRDEEGRKRFHGAFTGGFSAGYYNTVGSKEGWAPQSFTSSRKNRAEMNKQSIYNFLDEDEKAELEVHAFGLSAQFDTFGFTAAEFARKEADKDQQKRPSAIPGPIPDEIVVPAANSIGIKMLTKMGWRPGQVIREANKNSLSNARREARRAFLAFSSSNDGEIFTEAKSIKHEFESITENLVEDGTNIPRNTPSYVPQPKQDLYGLGFDPFKHAPEFRERQRNQNPGTKGKGNSGGISVKEKLFSTNSGKIAPGFGIGALEELDIEDEDIYASGFEFEGAYVKEVEEPSQIKMNNNRPRSNKKEDGALPGFRSASKSEYHPERFQPPSIPPGFEPYHKFPAPLEVKDKFAETPPLKVDPPSDDNLRLLIDGFASLVTRCGKLFEDLSKEKNKNNPLFAFLTGGNGHEYYTRRQWEERQKVLDQKKNLVDMKPSAGAEKMTAESRGRILGERPMERNLSVSTSSVPIDVSFHLQYNLTDTFTKPSSLIESSEVSKPFSKDPAKQERFEKFLKDKFQGGLRTTYSGGANNMSENDRARERVDFEATVEAIAKGEWRTTVLPPIASVTTNTQQLQLPQIEENSINYPRREEYQWRPFPILCKRFDIIDPFMGKPPPPPRVRGKIDSLIFAHDHINSINFGKVSGTNESKKAATEDEKPETSNPTTAEKESEINDSSVQKPVDLYKAIFSDDSDDDQDSASNQTNNVEKRNEAAHSTLNRLIADDFLESLGKELGLHVPPDSFNSIGTSNSSLSQYKESIEVRNIGISALNTTDTSTIKTFESLPSDRLNNPKSLATSGEVFEKVHESIPSIQNEFDHQPLKRSVDGSKYRIDQDKSKRRETESGGKHSRRHHRSNSSDSDSSYSNTNGRRKHSMRLREHSTSVSESSDDEYHQHRSKSKIDRRDRSRERKKYSNNRKHVDRKSSKSSSKRTKEKRSREHRRDPGFSKYD